MSPLSKRRSDQLLKLVTLYPRALLVTHDNPDPDAIASGWALQFLIEKKLGRSVRFVAGGEIIRSENRHMVQLLGAPIELVRTLEVVGSTAIILVDCGVDTSNHLLSHDSARPIGVIDHHQVAQNRKRLPFDDVRPEVAASASIAASYLHEQNIRPEKNLATALLYAIRTETRGSEIYHSRLDQMVIAWLTELADPNQLAEIENAPLSRNYFSDLVLALQATEVYGDTALCLLPRTTGPELVGEVADLLIRCEGINRVLCGAVYRGDLLLSVRTEHDGGNAANLAQTVLQGVGHGGGHEHRAGGKIIGVDSGPDITAVWQKELQTRWLAACGMDQQLPVHLITRQEIIQHL